MRSEKIDEAIQEVKKISFSKNNFSRIKKNAFRDRKF